MVASTNAGETRILETGTGILSGTLTVPAGAGPVPLVLIIAGSGPTDRNGNSPLLPGKNNSVKMLAEGLTSWGVAAVPYDVSEEQRQDSLFVQSTTNDGAIHMKRIDILCRNEKRRTE